MERFLKTTIAFSAVILISLSSVMGADEETESEDLDKKTLKNLRSALWAEIDALNSAETEVDVVEIIETVEPEVVEVVEIIEVTESETAEVIEYVESTTTSEVVEVIETTTSPEVVEVIYVEEVVSQARWNADTRKVEYDSGLSNPDKLSALNALYKSSQITAGVYHSERAQIN